MTELDYRTVAAGLLGLLVVLAIVDVVLSFRRGRRLDRTLDEAEARMRRASTAGPSFEAVLRLMPRGWIVWDLSQDPAHHLWRCMLIEPGSGQPPRLVETEEHATPAVALAKAIALATVLPEPPAEDFAAQLMAEPITCPHCGAVFTRNMYHDCKGGTRPMRVAREKLPPMQADAYEYSHPGIVRSTLDWLREQWTSLRIGFITPPPPPLPGQRKDRP